MQDETGAPAGQVVTPPEVAEQVQKSFIRMRFRGGRFDNVDGMPLEALPELTTLNELLITLGEELWRQKMGKKRIRDDSISYPDPPRLSVKRFVDGCSIPLIERQVVDVPERADGYDPYLASRDLLEGTIFSIVSENQLPMNFPKKYVSQLRRFGKTLKADESATFLMKDESGSFIDYDYSPAVRDSFWEDFDALTESDEIIVGHLESLDRKRQTFAFRRSNEQRLTGSLTDSALWDDLHTALGKAELYPYCRLHVSVEKDAMGRLRGIREVKRVEVLETSVEGWKERFEQLAESAFTNETGAMPVQTESFERAATVIQQAVENQLAIPVIFPSLEGGLSLVWQTAHDRTTVYIEPGEMYEVENVPDGPDNPLASSDATEVISIVGGFQND